MMKHKKKISILMMIMMVMGVLAGCSGDEAVNLEKERLVKTKTVEMSSMPETIYYFGFLEPKEVKSYAFKSGGRLEEVNVQSGDAMAIGDVLASLDSYEYNLSLTASAEQLNAASLDYDKAKAALDFTEKTYNDTVTIYEAGAVSKQQLDEIELQYDIKKKEVEQAQKAYNQAKVDYDFKANTLSETALVADMNGHVVDVLNKEGELVGEGYPVVIARSDENVVKVGMSQKDVKKVSVGDAATVQIDGDYYEGEITKINLMPDEKARTYDVEITMDEGDFIIGESCRVYIEKSDVEGIWLNITDIMNDGEDYVYVVEDGRAVRKNLELHEVNKSYVRVTGLEDGAEVIVEGRNALAEGYKVTVQGAPAMDESDEVTNESDDVTIEGDDHE